MTEIAEAHRDSIRAIGPRSYDEAVVDAWAGGVSPEIYLKAMAGGEEFFVAVGRIGGDRRVLGFSTHRIDDSTHGTAVYVRGAATRRGVGTALFRTAEAAAVAAGATSIEIASSLAATDFWIANGFEETGRGEQRLRSGATMPCVFMRKTLAAPRK